MGGANANYKVLDGRPTIANLTGIKTFLIATVMEFPAVRVAKNTEGRIYVYFCYMKGESFKAQCYIRVTFSAPVAIRIIPV